MEKILLTGNKDGFFNLVNDKFSATYDVYKCDYVNSTIRRTVKEVNPRVIICLKPINSNIVTIREIRDAFPDLKVFVICEKEDDSMNRYPGVRPVYFTKPFNIDVLCKEVDKYVRDCLAVENRKSILAVDDEGMVLRNIKQLLQDRYDLSFATSGSKALDTLEHKKFDLILLDYEMPAMNGYDVFVELKENPATKDIPVVFLTGVSDKSRIMEVVALRPAGYILKPIDSQLLISTLDAVFAQ